MIKYLFLIKTVLVIFLLISFGCEGKPKVIKQTPELTTEDQLIVDAGIRKAKDLGLKPVPLSTAGSGGVLILEPQTFSNEELIINATHHEIAIGSEIRLKRGQYARKIDNKFQIIE